MARTPRSASENLRGSPEAVEKRRLARKLNKLLTVGSDPSALSDGRTERRRQRLLKELEEGTRTDPPTLKPIEVLQHAHDLLTLGEPLASIRKVVRLPARPTVDPDEARALLAKLQSAYSFRPEVYEFLGLPSEVIPAEGRSEPPPEKPRRGRPRKT
ncbi:MAG: hypothetical protein U0326_32465 [Polyangiales bacterium]